MKVKTLNEPEPVKGCSGGKCLENSCLETPKSVTEKTLDRSKSKISRRCEWYDCMEKTLLGF